MNRQEIALLIGDKKFSLKVRWNPEIETILYHTHGVDFGKELSGFLCDEIKRSITPELISDVLRLQMAGTPIFKGIETVKDFQKDYTPDTYENQNVKG